tara:strand:+ start:71 stop:409 length:339 start_codon:yes stop_codon:yes gene_type:complete
MTMNKRKSIFELKQGSEKHFGYVLALLLFIFAMYPLTKNDGFTWELLLASICMLLLTFFSLSTLRPANLDWIKLGIFPGTELDVLVTGNRYLKKENQTKKLFVSSESTYELD